MDIASHAEDDQAEASLQVGANARQLIMEAVIQLQVEAAVSVFGLTQWFVMM